MVLTLEAFMSLPAYTFSGIYKELQKQFGSSVQNYIVAARLAQGYEQLAASTEQQRLDVVKRWQATQVALHKEKEQVKHGVSHQQSTCVFLRVKNATHASLEERSKHKKNGKLHKDVGPPKQASAAPQKDVGTPLSPQHSASTSTLMRTDSATFEEAVRQSVQATSHGNPQEDAMIERAIQASVMELRAASKSGDEDQAIQRAIQASVAEATKARREMSTSKKPAQTDLDDELHLALQRSMSSHPNPEDGKGQGYDDSGVDTDDDENMKLALEESKSDNLRSQERDQYQQRSTEESRSNSDRQQAMNSGKARTDEEIVLEYVKRQSLLEEEHRQSLASRKDATSRQDYE
ncbi:MAG: hypothetical protein Q9166_003053 [cf. Caloplaca sp. 2 TL-2023]